MQVARLWGGGQAERPPCMAKKQEERPWNHVLPGCFSTWRLTVHEQCCLVFYNPTLFLLSLHMNKNAPWKVSAGNGL